MKNLIFWFVILILVALLIAALYVRDVHFIAKYPLDFLIELLLIGFVPSFVLLILIKTRKLAVHLAFFWVLLISIKLVLFHVFAELAGIYTLYFPRY